MVSLKLMVEFSLSVLKQLDALGIVGRISYVVGLSVWTLLCLPTTPVELAAGISFPLLSATAMSALAKTVGSLVALLLGRRLLRPLIARYMSPERSGALHRHLVRELRENPIQTMSILRAAPLPTPFKIYGLSLFPAELVPVSTYAGIAICPVPYFQHFWMDGSILHFPDA